MKLIQKRSSALETIVDSCVEEHPTSFSLVPVSCDPIIQEITRFEYGAEAAAGPCRDTLRTKHRDVRSVVWGDVTGETIRVVQQKTGAEKLTIPLHADLRTILAAAPREHVAILTTEYGRAFTVDGFSGFMRDAIKGAGLPLDCQPHGLRKAWATGLAETDRRRELIGGVLGHKTFERSRTLHP